MGAKERGPYKKELNGCAKSAQNPIFRCSFYYEHMNKPQNKQLKATIT